MRPRVGWKTMALAVAIATLSAAPAAPAGAAESVKKPANPAAADARRIDRGRYLVRIGGCNDCHTAGYAAKDGKVPEKEWLRGDAVGWRGPWGTTYAVNLRLYMERLTEDQWVAAGKAMRTRPPMPWFNVNVMAESDLRAVYRYVRSLGAPGAAAPAYVPPDKEPSAPFVQFPMPPK